MSFAWINAREVDMQRRQLSFPESQMERLRRRAHIGDRPISDLNRRAAEDFLLVLAVTLRRNGVDSLCAADPLA